MEFCPTCGILLQYELPHMSRPARFFCPTCPYVCNLEAKVKIKRRQHLVKKEIEPIFSKDDMKNGPTTEATCPNCGFGKAVFQQMQISLLLKYYGDKPFLATERFWIKTVEAIVAMHQKT
ncbi:hypothetical protein TEA_010446 [Camellia sinensis var. sinensis]|uniref:DNA-directed RNA polymerase II subunit RPB9-like zinc ribbon domain-containing protein n=1 Tax=Camellia sinensis var. sinensis TaxID=542762 RepID=A0A4S4DP60_CAMSN|nr:hypothetical protein TEA_010446 [Camellia sinensis var. sinensis]